MNHNIISYNYPKSATINIEGLCNFKCNYCPYHSQTRTTYTEKNNYKISFDTAKEQIDILKSYGVKHINICATGEPFLNFDIFKIFKYIKNVGCTSSVLTNASSVISKSLQEIIDSDLLYFSTDLDADNRETFKEIQGRDQFDAWYKNIESLNKLRKLNDNKMKIVVNTIINKDTFNELDGMLDICIDLGIDEWSLNVLVAEDSNDYINNIKSMRYERELVSSKIEKLKKRANDNNIRLQSPEYFDINIDIYNDLECNKPWRESIMINVPLPNDEPGENIGRVVIGCTTNKSVEYNLGNIHKNTLEEIWNGSEFQRFRKNFIDGCDKECSDDCLYHKFTKKDN
ncbi:Radical SAM [Sulfurimonas denitrificans DSM 1251]|uniref:Radical SAM n=1 Tax=Sulfurimonas denitrificans (strain ATCC 33889 / DSM 1251) TaxID=326298 RepID=Q30U55_SULDN|nr:radical SAM protein [Sulfurimonas denitrificans]ABB43476.1 Radical SAM [Sulfurimonas denitrificans DSM 1251]